MFLFFGVAVLFFAAFMPVGRGAFFLLNSRLGAPPFLLNSRLWGLVFSSFEVTLGSGEIMPRRDVKQRKH